MLVGNVVKIWIFDFMVYFWVIYVCNDCIIYGNKLFKVWNVIWLDLEIFNVLVIVLYFYWIYLIEYFFKNV